MLECRVCLLSLPESDFYPSDLFRCRSCSRAYARAYSARKREEERAKRPADWKKKTADMKAYRRAWYAARPGYSARKKAEWLKARGAKEKRD
jgi:hypothetical protein